MSIALSPSAEAFDDGTFEIIDTFGSLDDTTDYNIKDSLLVETIYLMIRQTLFQGSRASEEVNERRSKFTLDPTVEGDQFYTLITFNTNSIDHHNAF